MNWTNPRPTLAPQPGKKSIQLEKILDSAKALVAAGQHEAALAELNRKNGVVLKQPAGQMMLGSIMSLTGRTDRALAAFDAAVRLAPKSATAHFNRGFALKQLGRPVEALAAYQAALRIDPKFVEAQHNLAVALRELGRLDEALAASDAAIRLKSGSAEAHYNRGIVLSILGRHEEALAAFDSAIGFRSAYGEAHIARGTSLNALGRSDAALEAFATAARQEPANPEAPLARAVMLRDAQRFDEALVAVEEALERTPDLFDGRFLRAGIISTLGRTEEALAIYDALAVEKPDVAAIQVDRGNTLVNLKRREDALAAFTDVVTRWPEMTEIHINRASELSELGRFDEALAACDAGASAEGATRTRAKILGNLDRFDEALTIIDGELRAHPDDWETLSARAITLDYFDRHDEALADLGKAIAVKPDRGELRFNRSLFLLKLGRFHDGWDDYEYRESGRLAAPRPLHDSPTWQGEDLTGKRLLVVGEQGFGDIIQFARYVPELVPQAAEICFATSPRLHRLLATSLPGVRFIDGRKRVEEVFDCHIRLISLPKIRGTDLDSIPRETPYLFADPDRIVRWRDRIPADGLRIGIHWQGNRDYAGDRRRSFPLAKFAPIAAIPGVHLISIQKNDGIEQLRDLPPGMSVMTLGDDFDAGEDAFLDTAALMQELDLVISSDSAVVHLGGALARPVWTLLPRLPDWRWLTGRSDTPWYPSMRLYRQTRLGDWDSVFAAVAEDARRLAAGRQS